MRKYVVARSVRSAALGGALVALGAAGWWVKFRAIDLAIPAATGFVSHELCSGVFVSGFDPEKVFAENINPRDGISRIAWALGYSIDSTHRAVTATFAGQFPSRAVYREGLGCRLVHDDEPADTSAGAAVAVTPSSIPLLPEIAGPDLVEPGNAQLRTALDRFFAGDRPPWRRATAAVVVHDGRVIAERYAPGYGVDTPMISYSLAKSITNALLGVLVRERRLSVDGPAPVAAWQDPADPRHAISIDQLERMLSGLALDEINNGFDPNTRMLYLEPDMAAYAESVPLETTPGSTWSYMSGNTIILSRIIRDAVGGHAADVLSFARRELFDPLGIRHMTIEFDRAGTPIGSTYMFAPAREWARFGMLYLNDGVVREKRLLPEGWVRYSSRQTLDSVYAAGFYVGRPDWRARWRLPSDAFFAAGIIGQRILIIPSKQLVIATFALSHGDPFEDIQQPLGQLASDVLTAVATEGGGIARPGDRLSAARR
jgi:CubicO group peptidase (beta-lactamase class C family)